MKERDHSCIDEGSHPPAVKESGHTPASAPTLLKENQEIFVRLARDFRAAENYLKTVELDSDNVDIPSINELRYVSYHTIKALECTEQLAQEEEINRARRHCQRASYDAVELALLMGLAKVKSFKEAYENQCVTDEVPDYLKLKKEVREIQAFMKEAGFNSDTKEAYYEKALEKWTRLKEIVEHLEDASDLLNGRIAERKRNRVAPWASAAVLGLSLLVSLYFNMTNLQNEQPSTENNPNATATHQANKNSLQSASIPEPDNSASEEKSLNSTE